MKECIDEGTLQAYFDNELGGEAAAAVATHLASCSACAQSARTVEAENLLMANALKSEFAESIPTARLRDGVEAAIAKVQTVRPVSATAAVRGLWGSLSALIFPSPRRTLGYASLAAVIILSAIFGVVYLPRGPVSPVAQIDPPKSLIPPKAASSPSPSPNLTGPDQVRKPLNPVELPQQLASRKLPRRSTTTSEFLPGERNYVRTIAALDSTIKSDAPLRPRLRVDYEHNLALLDQAIEMTRDAARKNPKDIQAQKFMYAAYQSKVELLNQVADAGRFNTEK
jgi:hypothetical protein